jgi:hypothetical protein
MALVVTWIPWPGRPGTLSQLILPTAARPRLPAHCDGVVERTKDVAQLDNPNCSHSMMMTDFSWV